MTKAAKRPTKGAAKAEAIQSPHLAAVVAAMARGVYRASVQLIVGALAAVWLVPAVLINLDMAKDKGLPLTAGAVAAVVACAIAVHRIGALRDVTLKALAGVLIVAALSFNLNNAIRNTAAHRGDSRDVKTHQQTIASTVTSQIASLKDRRKAQAAIVGEAPPATIEAELAARKSKDATRWRSTEGCKEELTTARDTKTFCEQVHGIEGRLAAARERDKLQARIDELEAKDTKAPSSLDPGTDTIAMLFGAESEVSKTWIAASSDWLTGIVMELMAAVMPALILHMFAGASKEAVPEPVRKRAKATKAKAQEMEPEPAEAAPEPVTNADADNNLMIDRFYAARLEPAQDETIQPRPLLIAWHEFCRENGIDPGKDKGFSQRIQRLVRYERNNGRPRYVGIRLKPARPQLRVVAK